MKKTHAFLLILIASLIATPAFAQTYRSQLHFLEQFAVRQYERGDKENAMKQFGWLLRIEPDNAIAHEYVKKFAAEPASTAKSNPAPERINQIITDISNVGSDLIEYEKETRELEGLIRDLITENDALYQSLYKRSREVVELREKFYGTPYGDAYASAMKSLPMDRVPQRLHRANDILPENAAVAGKSREEQITTLLNDITALSKERSATVETAATAPSPEKERLDTALTAKRNILLEKTMTLADKRESLDQLKKELLDINNGLKRGNNRYIEAIQKIDAYYSRLKEKIAKKNYVEQKMFSDLVADYANKLKEIETLKSSVRTRDDALPAFKPVIASANEHLRDIDEAMKSKDAQIAEFKDQLIQYKQQLSERETTIKTQNETIKERESALSRRNDTLRQHETLIQRQKTDLSMAGQKLDDVDGQVSDIEKALKDSDAQLARLKTSLAHPAPAPSVEKNDPALERRIELQALHIKNLETQNTNIAAFLEKSEKALQEATDHIRSLEEQLVAVGVDLKKPIFPINDPEKKTLREQATQAKAEAENARQNVANTNESMNSLTIREQKLIAKMTDYESLVKKVKDLDARIKSAQLENSSLNEALAKMKTIEQDNAKLRETVSKTLEIQNENSQLRQKLLDTTAQVTARSKQLAEDANNIQTLKDDVEARDKHIAALSERVAVLQQDQRSLHPATDITRATDKDAVEDLKKRLNAAYEKLTATESSMTRAASESAGLKEQLAERDAQIETLKTGPSIKGNADKKALMDAIMLKDEELTAVKTKLAAWQNNNVAAVEDAIASKNKELLDTKELSRNQSARIQMLTEANNQLSARIDQMKASMAAQSQAPVLGTQAQPPVQPVKDPGDELRRLTLDLQEKDLRISQYERALAIAQDAANTAQMQAKTAEEKDASHRIKQEAIDQIMNDREIKIAKLSTEIQALKNELAATKTTQKDNLARVDEAAAAKSMAEKELQSHNNALAQLQDRVKTMAIDLKSAKTLIEKKDRDHDATLKELRKISDILDQKRAELNALQRRADNNARKTPAPATVNVKAPDCFKDCVQK